MQSRLVHLLSAYPAGGQEEHSAFANVKPCDKFSGRERRESTHPFLIHDEFKHFRLSFGQRFSEEGDPRCTIRVAAVTPRLDQT